MTLYAIDLGYGLLKISFLQRKYVCKAQKVSFPVICDKEIFLLGKCLDLSLSVGKGSLCLTMRLLFGLKFL